MIRSASLIAVISAGVLVGQTAPAERQSASEYPASASAAPAAIGAEFLARSVPAKGGVLFARDYLVFDIGVFPKPGPPVTVSNGQFSLIINGAKIPLETHTPGTVAASMQYSDWEQHPELNASATVDGTGVSTPQTWPGQRFPGDGRADPHPGRPVAITDSSEPLDAQVAHVSLPTGTFSAPVRGCIYFQYKGKVKRIHSMRLLWDGPAGAHTELTLR